MEKATEELEEAERQEVETRREAAALQEQIEKMIKEAEQVADENNEVKERVDAENACDGYIRSMRSATEGSGEAEGLNEKMDSDEKDNIMDALR